MAPAALIGGWTWAADRQPGDFSPVHETISALAARGATDRWIMTTGLAALGACHVVTALGLRPARRAGRLLLAAGGVATMVVAAAPQPEHGSSALHLAAAGAGFVTLSLWPVFATTSTTTATGLPVPPVLRRRTGVAVSAVLLALLGWLAVEIGGGDLLGLSERLLAGAQSLWPLVVVLGLRGRAARMAP
ncbi:MAG: DUF998 domain-containing protein [Actinomycetota bacterium]|nr:DUF998 domain-containing protein [Actinomycetota bacterium]